MRSPSTAPHRPPDIEVWQPEPRQALGASFARLADWLGRALWLSCAVSAVSLVVELWGSAGPAARGVAGQGGPIPDYAALASPLYLIALLAFVVTGAMWMVWQHRAASAAGEALRRSPAWHVRAWFVPVANLWLVPANLADLWRTYRAPRRLSEVPPGPPVIVYAWWLSGVAAAGLNGWALVVDATAITPVDHQVAGLLSSLAALVTALAAGIAANLVRRLSWYALLVNADAA